MKRKFAFIFISIGIILIAYSVWQIIATKLKTEATVKEAHEIVKQISKEDMVDFSPNIGETIGILTIPKIEAQLAIVEGTDPDELEKGVGHYSGSYFPNQNGQIVLSGHRDTVFRKLGELETGDQLKMTMPFGHYTYKIIKTKIVEADDTSIITLQNKKEELILTTCYPFRFVGNAPQRYIIYSERIK
ncbi:C60A subfamily peptidase [Bacillus freudenreichii]|nr:C60A subfamily peptidase [Bacillus freudenreichii]